MTKRLLRYILLLPLFLGIFSCQNSGEASNVLADADSLMQTRPDSALLLLEGISAPQLLSRAHRAEYALLLTQARHKNYVKLENDSLIKIAVDYYEDGNDNLRESQAYFYLGSTYRDMGDMASTIKAYLKALEVMPENSNDDFLTKVYDNLGDCCEQQDLYKEALYFYKRSYLINLKSHDEKNLYYPLRGIANVSLYKLQIDSASIYYHKALDVAQSLNDTTQIAVVFKDLSSICNEQQDYKKAVYYISEALKMMHDEHDLFSAYCLKGRIMNNLNNLDSACYYYSLSKKSEDIYVKASSYYGLYEIEKKFENWETATLHADSFFLLYDSIQGLSERAEIDKLMDNHLLERHKSLLSFKHRRTMIVIGGILLLFIIVGVFLFMWLDKRRKTRYIALQQQLMQSRVDDMQMEEESFPNNTRSTNKLPEFKEEQLKICIQLFRTTDCYKKMIALEHASLKEQRNILKERQDMCNAILKTFIDVIQNLRDCCPMLTNDDLFYSVLSLINCSKKAIMDLMDVSPDALKTRKNRIKNKMTAELFLKIFHADNH